MKRTLLASALVLLAFSASAVVGHNGSDGDLSITSSSSASKAVSPNGTQWSSTFSETATRNTSTGVNSYEFSGNSVNFSGVFRVPNPCYTVEGEVVKASDNSYEFLVKAVDSSEENQSCAQVISYRGYNSSFQTDEPFKLEVVHGNESVETLRHPDLDTAEPEPRPDRQNNPISKIVSWVKNLFSGGPEPVE